MTYRELDELEDLELIELVEHLLEHKETKTEYDLRLIDMCLSARKYYILSYRQRKALSRCIVWSSSKKIRKKNITYETE